MLPDLFLVGLSHLWVGLAALLFYLAVGVPGKEGQGSSHVGRMVLLLLAVIVLVFIAYSVYKESI
jgi:membrane protein DedA with SNARE-associated domain